MEDDETVKMWSRKEEKECFWRDLLKEGSLCPVRDKREDVEIPEDFNADLFKRGQEFARKNIFAVFVGNLAGLITMLTLRSSLDNRPTKTSVFSPDSMEQQLDTMDLLLELYEEDSIGEDTVELKNRLNTFKRTFLGTIDESFLNQRDLALVQFAFSGFILCRPHLLGIDPSLSAEDLEAFRYFWDILGHFLGIDSRFNVCGSSIEKTKSRLLEMTPNLIGPAILNHSNTFVRIALEFVDLFWYFRPLISVDLILLLSSRLAGLPGFYLNEKERLEDVKTIHEHKEYLHHGFNRRLLQCETYNPRCFSFTRMSWKDKAFVLLIVDLFQRYSKSPIYRWILNGFVWLGRTCKRQLSFMVVGLGFKSSYSNFLTMRRVVLRKGRDLRVLLEKEDLNGKTYN